MFGKSPVRRHPGISFDREHVTEALRSVITNACPFKVLQKQKHYMRRYMRKPQDMKVCTYVHSLMRINIKEIPHLPPFSLCLGSEAKRRRDHRNYLERDTKQMVSGNGPTEL
jgi:hypothetical protein